MERTFSYETSCGCQVTYYISNSNDFLVGQFGSATNAGLAAAKREVWQALAAYRLTPLGQGQ